jgi:uncharacterized delta-60 repeat protein
MANTFHRSLSAALSILCIGAASGAPIRDGDLDPGFGDGGAVVVQFPGSNNVSSSYTDVGMQPDGALLVAVSASFNAQADFGVVRFDADGTLDSDFGVGGAAVVAFDRQDSGLDDLIRGIAVQPDGKIVLSGVASGADSDSDFAIARLTADGLPDSSFGTAGKVLVPFNLGAVGRRRDEAYRVTLQSDGKVLVAGNAENDAGSVIAIARLLPGGQRDTGFDDDGRATVDFGVGEAAALRVRQLADGSHLLAVGVGAPAGNNDFALAKFNDDGSPDATFAGGGKTTYAFDIGGTLEDIASDFVELPDGRLLVCGAVMVNAPLNYDFACMRFLADGTPDPAFARVLVPIDSGEPFTDVALRIERDVQGRLLVGGSCSRATGNNDFCLVRLTADGELDADFGQAGVHTYASQAGGGTDLNNQAFGLVVQPDGKIVLGGFAQTESDGRQIQVVRVFGDHVFGNGFE